MKSCIGALSVMVALWSVAATAQDKPLYPVENWEKFSAAERELIAIDQQTIEFRRVHDAAGLAALLTDDLMLVSEAGLRDKDTFVKATSARAGQPIEARDPDAPAMRYTIRIHGDTAMMVHGNLPGISHFFVREDGRWKISGWVSATSTEDGNNRAGYTFLEAKKVDDALTVFKVNVLMFPKSANAYDSLAEAYLVAGDKDNALQNYRKALELDPKMASALAAVAKLQGK